MNLLTGLPYAVAAQMIGDGDVSAQGVMGPEACLEHTTFLRRLAEGGIRFFEGEDMASPLQL